MVAEYQPKLLYDPVRPHQNQKDPSHAIDSSIVVGPMKIKAEPSYKITISRRCMLIALLALNIIVVLKIAPMYGRLLLAVLHGPPAPPSAIQHHLHDHEQKRQISIRHRTLPSTQLHSEIPFIGQDTFIQKYSSIYKGLLPSSTRESPDPSCGYSPDFFDFFRLPKTERYEHLC